MPTGTWSLIPDPRRARPLCLGAAAEIVAAAEKGVKKRPTVVSDSFGPHRPTTCFFRAASAAYPETKPKRGRDPVVGVRVIAVSYSAC